MADSLDPRRYRDPNGTLGAAAGVTSVFVCEYNIDRAAARPHQEQETQVQTQTGRNAMSATLINLIIQLIAGAVGGNAAAPR